MKEKKMVVTKAIPFLVFCKLARIPKEITMSRTNKKEAKDKFAPIELPYKEK